MNDSRIITAILTFLLMTLAAAAGAGPAGGPPEPVVLNPQTATPVLTVGRTTVWKTRDLVESSRNNRAQRFTTRYWLADAGDDDGEAVPPLPRLAYEMTSTGYADPLAVFPDGTLLLRFYSTLIWAEPGKDPVEERLRLGDREAVPMAAWPDGVLLQEHDENAEKPVYFVPIVGQGPRKVNLGAKVRITHEPGLRVNWQRPFVRAGDLIAWQPVAAAAGAAAGAPPGSGGVLPVYDVANRRRADVPLKHVPHPDILAFDGRRVLLRSHLVDLDTGAETEFPRLDAALTLYGGHVYHMVARGGRYILEALPVDDPTRPRELLSVPAYLLAGRSPSRSGSRAAGEPGAEGAIPQPQPGQLNNAAIALDDGIRVWTGKGWAEVAYLDGPPKAE